ncbi:hypothetical protein PR001_g2515 [Phytophthora rubi]|uniref:PiggyBac transposable element-derived protein domain-containing protein n=1 Tax=Phytophthora rubi TaxID=129364 RepID=A0A6A3P071_9STRA|nr:hypothetical protein PR001_g2515 [Phytophthora rubi]
MIRDYHRWMGGVDVHDQLRLQRYSLQLAVTFRKYYKTVFLGLVDMALVNAFIVFREAQDQRGEKRTDHSMFLKLLQSQMLDLTAADFASDAYLCDRTWPHSKNGYTCHQLGHLEWANGAKRPRPNVGRGIQMRATRVKSSRTRAPDDSAAGAEDVSDEAQSNGNLRRIRGQPRTRRRRIAHDRRVKAPKSSKVTRRWSVLATSTRP